MTIAGIPPSTTLVQELTDRNGVKWQLRLVRCGKRNCSRCPHGPYWFKMVLREKDGTPVWRYRGKEGPTND
jgi:hypothetical protein